jgi:carboxymethylenebutenolidase
MKRAGLLLVGLILGCERSGTPPAASSSPPSAAAPAISSAKPNPVSGALSEEEFKRLHELKGEAAPAARGVPFELAGGSKSYLSLPPGAKPPLPGLVVIHEWWGLNEHIKHYADRFAAEGYAALAVDLFGGQVATTPDQAMNLTKAVDAAVARDTLRAAYAALASDPRIKATRRGSIGWCFGGKWSLNLALAEPGLNAAVVYYGHIPTDPGALAPLKAPLLAIFGARDGSIPLETVKKFEAALKQNGAQACSAS